MVQDSAAGMPATIRYRTCIAHRETKPDTQLLRVVVDPAEPRVLIPDPRRRLPGRGAWITPSMPALEIAEKRGAFARALRVAGPVDTGQVRAYLTALDSGQESCRLTDQRRKT